jgi:hypothetical protein
MPVEIHRGDFLNYEPPSTPPKMPKTRDQKPSTSAPVVVSSSLKYIFIHDLESLWWIMLWIFLRVSSSEMLGTAIFDMGSVPHPDREQFFRLSTGLEDCLKSCVHKELIRCEAPLYLTIYHDWILRFYGTRDRDDVTKYHNVYNSIWDATADFIDHMEGIDLKLGDAT